MDVEKKTRFRWVPAHTGLAVTAGAAAVLLAGRGEGASAVWYVPVFSLAAGLLAAFFHAKRLKMLLGGLVLGLLIGTLSSFSLLGQPVEGLFFMVASTVTFFVALLLVAGAFLEFVFFLHRVTHDAVRGRAPAKKA